MTYDDVLLKGESPEPEATEDDSMTEEGQKRFESALKSDNRITIPMRNLTSFSKFLCLSLCLILGIKWRFLKLRSTRCHQVLRLYTAMSFDDKKMPFEWLAELK